MIINDQGREIIMRFEGCVLKPYKCPAGIWTVGYGHTGPDVDKWAKAGRELTLHQAEEILEFDLQRFEEAVTKLVPKANSNQFSAFVSLAFNIGVKEFEKSTLLRLFKAGGPLAAAHRFADWRFAGKNPDGSPRELLGLVRRRAAEKSLFLTVPS